MTEDASAAIALPGMSDSPSHLICHDHDVNVMVALVVVT